MTTLTFSSPPFLSPFSLDQHPSLLTASQAPSSPPRRPLPAAPRRPSLGSLRRRRRSGSGSSRPSPALVAQPLQPPDALPAVLLDARHGQTRAPGRPGNGWEARGGGLDLDVADLGGARGAERAGDGVAHFGGGCLSMVGLVGGWSSDGV